MIGYLAAQAISSAARCNSLADWLSWQQKLHPKSIDLGLDRVRAVLDAMGMAQPPYCILTVAGTNGKGSSAAFLAAILQAAGYHVGVYTSPHLLRYNERIRIAGHLVDDRALCDSFALIDQLRADISLTFFEFGTLAALQLFAEARIEVAVLEVGLGGRLDAVNAVDADAALVTAIGIDHVDWLGDDREQIGYEKAGIFRAGRPAVCADPLPPRRLLEHAHALGTPLSVRYIDYNYHDDGVRWHWWTSACEYQDLPRPALLGVHQLANAAGALMLLERMKAVLPVSEIAIHQGLTEVSLLGRLQRLPGAVEWVLDVAHNVDAANALAAALQVLPPSRQTHIVLATLRDKDAEGVAQALSVLKPCWHLAGLAGLRGQSSSELAQRLRALRTPGIIHCYEDVAAACAGAALHAYEGDRIVVCGSFNTVATAWRSGLPLARPEKTTILSS